METSPGRIAVLAAVHLYQAVLGPALAPDCAFTPSCSAFGAAAVHAHGAVAGGWLAADRVSRCHAFAILGGYALGPAGTLADPLPAPTTPVLPPPARPRHLAAELCARGEWDAAHLESMRLALTAPDPEAAGAAWLLAARCAWQARRYPEAVRDCALVPAGTPAAARAAELTAIAARADALPARSAWTSGVLSALVPGLGQVAAGYPWDGVSALVLTGGSLALLAEGLRRDHRGLTVAGAVLVGVWYPANVAGGARAPGRARDERRRAMLESADPPPRPEDVPVQ